ncbi:DUF1223 domain-containing protein [Rugamonas apoptosis]|uniref:DUF1223 domain-containing protein n=1 Tax=Rugamonas apoptosis TaxID=2758570 RepID=A0A7W2IMA9_9BURK|nr:DUF1223 domain-containing protein [Rugamonas apoptosis]MBA5689493.1 DUF1223 domain-containing protein [Rugamonas apoptosis]
MKQLILSLSAAAALNVAPVLAANSCSAHSPAYRVALLELYTSEGCSSCPPADQYISGLRAAGVTPAQAVLLALHVDYWNDIGWKDPFSQAAYSERQRWLTKLAGSRTVYTPELFVAGQELRGGVDRWSGGVPAAVKRINAQPAQAEIRITLGQASAAGLPVEVNASAAHAGKLFVALVESGLASKVTAGENSGRLLRHDHVVRTWLAPVPLSSGDKAGVNMATVTRTLPLPSGAVAGKLGVSAFVQSERGEVLQALTLPACGG